MLPVGNKARGKVILNIFSVGFFVISLVSAVALTDNPLKTQIISTLAKDKEEKKAAQNAAKNEKTKAQKNADNLIARLERATGCSGADCVAGTVIRNAATSGSNSNAAPSAQTAAEQALIDKYVTAAVGGNSNALNFIKANNADLYNIVVSVQTKAVAPPQAQPANALTSPASPPVVIATKLPTTVISVQGTSTGTSLATTTTTTTTIPTATNQNPVQTGFGTILTSPSVATQPQVSSPTVLQPVSSSTPVGLKTIGTGPCLAHCDGARMYQLYSWYKAQPDGWWYNKGQFTPTDFAAMMVMGESLGSNDPTTAKTTATKVAEAISNQLSYSSPQNARSGYCSTSDCQGGGGVLNFVGAYSQSAWVRYNSLIDNPSSKTLTGLKDQQLANYFAKTGLSLQEISQSIVNKPGTKADYINLPTEWGCRGCADPGLKWISAADAHNAPTGTTDPRGVYYEGKDGEVVYTLNQANYWGNYKSAK